MRRLIGHLKKHRRIYAAVCVAGLLCLGIGTADHILNRKFSAWKLRPFYESELSFDVLYFGTSHVYDGLSPLVLWKEYGITSYNLGFNSGELALSYWNLKLALKEGRKPEYVVVDVFEDKGDTGVVGLSSAHRALDYFSLDALKWQAVSDLFEEEDQREELLVPLSIYHNRWKELSKDDLLPGVNETLGYQQLWGVAKPDQKIIQNRAAKKELNRTQREYLTRIAKLCKEEGIKLLFIKIPCSYRPDWQMRDNSVYELAEELGVPFINYMNEETNIDFDMDFYDVAHLNVTGAHKMTRILGAELKRMGARDRRKEAIAPVWDEMYEVYEKSNAEFLTGCTDLKTYLSALYQDAYTVEIRMLGTLEFEEDSVYGKLLSQLSGIAVIDDGYGALMRGGQKADISITVRWRDSGELIDEASFRCDTAETARRL